MLNGLSDMYVIRAMVWFLGDPYSSERPNHVWLAGLAGFSRSRLQAASHSLRTFGRDAYILD